MKASDSGNLPANARQIMYAARPYILRLTGKMELDDHYFTQDLLPNFIAEHNKHDWNVAYDSRGSLNEPHTGREVPLGTLGVRDYVDGLINADLVPDIAESPPGDRFPEITYPTNGPICRYKTILFIEKEGFFELLKAARIAERYDIAVMSTKGMSVTAARHLLDRLGPWIEQVLVLHDFDVSGFSIFGTLRRDSRRYTFANRIKFVDIGLRLADVEQMKLESEPVKTKGDWRKRAHTLKKHGATQAEIHFLENRRVELNAMTSRQMVRHIEQQLELHGVTKVVPDLATIERQARMCIMRRYTHELQKKHFVDLQAAASAAELPADLRGQVKAMMERHPELPWDLAVEKVLRNAKD